ncbi:MAG: hypothetical protein R3338_01850 [Thermoanaerobaculia bacterium]|nr:hypothetical protein [Thermoanaerobaculia bacterium]
MHECPQCGTTLTARPSHCYVGGKPLSTMEKAGSRGFHVLVFFGVAVATIFLIGRTLIG